MTSLVKRIEDLEQVAAPRYATLAQAVNAARAQAGVVHDVEEAALYWRSAGLKSAALFLACIEKNRLRRTP